MDKTCDKEAYSGRQPLLDSECVVVVVVPSTANGSAVLDTYCTTSRTNYARATRQLGSTAHAAHARRRAVWPRL